jgi:colicin import membrane protein
MRTAYPGAYGVSLLLHALAAGLLVFFSYAATSMVKDSPKVLELVAGAGDNYRATDAPALGSAGGVTLTAPAVTPLPPAPKAQAAPVQPAPLEAVPAPAKAARPPKPVDLVKSLKQAEARRERNLEKKYQREKEAEQKRLTQEEFLRQQQAAKGTRVSHVDAEGIAAGVVGGSTQNKEGGAGGKALTREEAKELDLYFSLLKARIRENHTPPEGVSDSVSTLVEFYVAADGSLSRVHVLKSSGNTDFDLSVVEACNRTQSIGPRPDGRGEMVKMTFKVHEDSG